jgi:hypothetical protein
MHMIPQVKLEGDFQAKVYDHIARPAAFCSMIGSAHRTPVEHRA